MVIIRPVQITDLDALLTMAHEVGAGMTTFPRDADLLAEKIESSVKSFNRSITEPSDERYMMVLEDTATGELGGVASVIATIGVDQPFYSFRIIRLTHASHELGRYESVRALHMVEAYRGSSEVATLYVKPTFRHNRQGRLMSRGRFMLIADHPQRFADRIIAEMRGQVDEDGHSSFWNAVGRHFLKMDFAEADTLSGAGNYRFIANMMPKHPLYVRMLADQAQQVIGRPHSNSLPAMKLLEKEGFRFENCVDVFDGGPTVHCHRDLIYTVRESQTAPVTKRCDVDSNATIHMISNQRLNELRIVQAPLELTNDGVVIGAETAQTLQVQAGDSLRFIAL